VYPVLSVSLDCLFATLRLLKIFA